MRTAAALAALLACLVPAAGAADPWRGPYPDDPDRFPRGRPVQPRQNRSPNPPEQR